MRLNEATADRWIRIVIGVVAGIVAFAVGITTAAGVILAIVAVLALLTGAIGFCPIYALAHISTRRDSGHHHAAQAS